MPYEFKTTRTVEFADTDMAGIMHFANYFRWMEATEHQFIRSLGFSVHRQDDDGGMCGWPRVRAECEYDRPLHYEDEVEIHLLIRRISGRSIVYDFRFFHDGGEPVARGRLTVVHVSRGRDESGLRAIPIEPELAALLQEAPAELLEEV